MNHVPVRVVVGLALAALVVSAVLVLAPASSMAPVVVAAGKAPSIAGANQVVAGEAKMLPPTLLKTRPLRKPPMRTTAQRKATEAFMDKAEKAWEARTQAIVARAVSRGAIGRVAEPEPGPKDKPTLASGLEVEAALDPPLAAPDTFEIHVRSDLAPPLGFSSSVNEPAVASSGRFLFYTHNWYAARSFSHGQGYTPWIYIDPYADFDDFCCDQDVIYDKGRDVFIWERMGISPDNVQNRFKLGISGNGGATFCTYDVFPANIGRPDGFWDYPRLSLSNDYLYMTWNLFQNGPPFGFIANILLRFPLDALASCSGFSFPFWYMPEDGWSPAAVENAREVMYFGDNPVFEFPVNNGFRVLWQPEENTTLFWVDRGITPYLFTNRNDAVCPVPGGANPCARSDQRVIGGVLANGQLDFFWNVRQGGGFPLPYVESAGFDAATIGYNARKLVWNPDLTWFYAAVAANDRDHVGMSVMAFFPTIPAAHFVGIDDDFNGAPPGWEVAFVRLGAQNWTASQSGDYLRVRTSGPQGVGWIGTGYTRQIGHYDPFFVEWRRGRDIRGTQRFEQK